MTEKRIINHQIYTVSFQDLIDVWIETLHPENNVVIVWDAKNHLDILKKSGFIIDEVKIYNNKILTIVVEDIRDTFYIMDIISSYKSHPFVQIYRKGTLLTDNIELLD